MGFEGVYEITFPILSYIVEVVDKKTYFQNISLGTPDLKKEWDQLWTPEKKNSRGVNMMFTDLRTGFSEIL